MPASLVQEAFLSPLWFSFSLSLFLASLFVGSLYIWIIIVPLIFSKQKSLPILQRLKDRDDPLTIKFRTVSVLTSSFISVFIMIMLSQVSLEETFICLGIRFDFEYLALSLIPLVLVMILFAGPLAQLFVDRDWPLDFSSPIFLFRNLIVTPLTEEIVFRGCICPLLLGSGLSRTTVILTSPLFFGAAHLHHVLAGIPLPVVLFQFGFTTVFGWMSSYIFIRSGSLLSAILSHMFCNMMGFPDFGSIPHHPHAILLVSFLVGGLFLFFCSADLMTSPWMYSSSPPFYEVSR
jgi:prenyl protein peptidase